MGGERENRKKNFNVYGSDRKYGQRFMQVLGNQDLGGGNGKEKQIYGRCFKGEGKSQGLNKYFIELVKWQG